MRKIILLISVVAGGCVAPGAATQPNSLKFEVETRCSQKKLDVVLSLSNDSDQVLRIQKELAPWVMPPGGVELSLAEQDKDSKILANIDWPKLGSDLQLGANEKSQKSVEFSDAFQDVVLSDKKKYILNWQYRNPLDASKSFIGGAVVAGDQCL